MMMAMLYGLKINVLWNVFEQRKEFFLLKTTLKLDTHTIVIKKMSIETIYYSSLQAVIINTNLQLFFTLFLLSYVVLYQSKSHVKKNKRCAFK